MTAHWTYMVAANNACYLTLLSRCGVRTPKLWPMHTVHFWL